MLCMSFDYGRGVKLPLAIDIFLWKHLLQWPLIELVDEKDLVANLEFLGHALLSCS